MCQLEPQIDSKTDSVCVCESVCFVAVLFHMESTFQRQHMHIHVHAHMQQYNNCTDDHSQLWN